MDTLKAQILDELEHLTPAQQAEVLVLARTLRTGGTPPGTPGEVLIARARAINFPHEDLQEIIQAIEEDCERIDPADWQ